jgi:type II secretory pathway pseudopilin PulG
MIWLRFKTFAMAILAAAIISNGPSPTCDACQDSVQDYIPSSAFALVDIKPKSALAQPSMNLVPTELIKVFGEKELGVNLLEIGQVTFVMDQIIDPDRAEPPDFGVRIQFDSPQTLSEKVLGKMEASTLEGRKSYVVGREQVSLVIVDEKTLMLGTDNFLKKMLNARGASSPLLTRLKAASPDDHLNLIVMVEPIRALLKEQLPPPSQVPPPFREFLKLPDLIGSISYRSNFSPAEIAQLTIEAVDGAAVEEINRMMEQAVELAKAAALSAIAEQINFNDQDYRDAVMAYADRLTAAIKQGIKPVVSGNDLVYDLNAVQGGNNATSVATIGVLTGMLLPAVQQAREAARRAAAMNTLRQLALAALNYESAYMSLPMQASYDDSGTPLLSWRVHLLPFLEENNLYQQFKLDEPWDSPHNIKLLDKMPAIYKSPNFDDERRTIFLAISGPGTVFPGNQKVKFANITDGTSNSAMFVEADPGSAVEWTRPVDWKMDPDDPMQGLGHLRPGGFNVVLCDGSVHFISNMMDPANWRNIVTIADGNAIDW